MAETAYPDANLGLSRGRLAEVFDTQFQFTDRPAPVPADIRADWRVPLLMLIVNSCRNKRASLQQVQAIAWPAIFEECREGFVKALKGNSNPGDLFVRYDPAVTRAVNLAVGLGLLSWQNRIRLAITDRGRTMLEGILERDNVLMEERMFLSELGTITMISVDRILGR